MKLVVDLRQRVNWKAKYQSLSFEAFSYDRVEGSIAQLGSVIPYTQKQTLTATEYGQK